MPTFIQEPTFIRYSRVFMDNPFEQAKLGEAANRESCLCRVVGSISIRIDANQGPFRRSQNEI